MIPLQQSKLVCNNQKLCAITELALFALGPFGEIFGAFLEANESPRRVSMRNAPDLYSGAEWLARAIGEQSLLNAQFPLALPKTLSKQQGDHSPTGALFFCLDIFVLLI